MYRNAFLRIFFSDCFTENKYLLSHQFKIYESLYYVKNIYLLLTDVTELDV